MKVLILKDLYVLWKQMRVFIIILLVISISNGTFGSVFIVLWAAMLPYTAMAYDERSKWDQLAAMMPYSTRDLVLSKYVLGWLCTGAAGILAAVVQIVVRAVTVSPEAGVLNIVLISVCASVCVLDITLPPIFWFGVERGRMVMFLIIFLVCGGTGALGTVTGSVEQSSIQGLLGFLTLALPVAAVALTVISVPLSLRLYQRRT